MAPTPKDFKLSNCIVTVLVLAYFHLINITIFLESIMSLVPPQPVSDVMTHIKKGGRLDCPENCPPEVYKIVKTCWYERPEERPTFKELLEQLKALPPSASQP